MIDAAPGNEIPRLLEEADKLFLDQKFDRSLELFEKLVGMEPGNPKNNCRNVKMFTST